MNTRKTLFALFAILLVGGLGVWWYFGFTLDFMRFFAADTGVVTSPGPTKSTPPGCYYQEVQCFAAPCDPVLVCPSCLPRPSCLDTVPACKIAEPAEGWCPGPTKPAPPGCYYQEVQCIQAPCYPQLVCPSSSPTGGGIVQCSPATQTVKVGSGAQVSAAGGNSTYEWFAPESNPSNRTAGGATFSVSYTTSGTKKVTVQSPRGDGSSNVDSVACTVIVTQ